MSLLVFMREVAWNSFPVFYKKFTIVLDNGSKWAYNVTYLDKFSGREEEFVLAGGKHRCSIGWIKALWRA